MLLRKRVLFVTTVFSIALLLAGCFSFGSSPKKVPTPAKTSVSGVISAPQGTAGLAEVESFSQPTLAGFWSFIALTAQAQETVVNVPVRGAKVVALEVPSLKVISTTAVETDAEGRYTMTGLPEGRPVIIVATKEVADGQTIRLSTYVPKVTANKTTDADADAATSLATEALAHRMSMRNDGAVEDSHWEALWKSAHVAAQEVVALAASDPEELATLLVVGEGAVQEGDIGAGLQEEYDRQLGLPEDPLSDEALARAMIQALRDAGYSIKDTLDLRLARHQEHISEELNPHLEELGRIINRGMDVIRVTEDHPNGGEFDHSLYDEYFRPVSGTTANYDRWVVHLYDFGYDPEFNEHNEADYRLDTYTIERLGDNRYKVTATKIPHDVTVEYENSRDSKLVSLKYVDGTITLDTGVVTFTDVEATTTFREVERSSKFFLVLEESTYKGEIRSDLFRLDGSMTYRTADDVEYCYSYWDDYYESEVVSGPCYAPATEIDVDGVLETNTLTLNGHFNATAEYRNPETGVADDAPEPVTAEVTFHGELIERNVDEPFQLTGHLEMEWDATQAPSKTDSISGRFYFNGKVELPGHAPIELEITGEPVDDQVWKSELRYERGDHVLEGEAIIQVAGPFEVHLELVDSNDLAMVLDYTEGGEFAEGVIRKSDSDEVIADIQVGGPGIIEVTYRASGYIESLF